MTNADKIIKIDIDLIKETNSRIFQQSLSKYLFYGILIKQSVLRFLI